MGDLVVDEVGGSVQRGTEMLPLTATEFRLLARDTASFRYVRLHGHTGPYASRYDDRELDKWAARCRAWADPGQDVHVHCENDMQGHAPHDAVRFLQRFGPAEYSP